ncbi:phosphoribosyltransferase [Clostridium butyricum]|uniref:phosphoribosyltransferase n=1 Tax=Clostridium butyricum TaxID=1492 RepID=UPI003D332B0E
MEKGVVLKYWSEKDIYYITDYHQYSLYDNDGNKLKSPEFNNKNGGYILNLKKYGKKFNNNSKVTEFKYNQSISEALMFYKKKLVDILKSDNKFNNGNFIITTVPPHDANNSYDDGMKVIAQFLSNEIPSINYYNCLKRIRTIEKLSCGGKRSIKIHLNSIEVSIDRSLIENKKILLLDDVTTTGNSLIACKKLLERNGAEVICLSLSKTIDRKSYEEAINDCIPPVQDFSDKVASLKDHSYYNTELRLSMLIDSYDCGLTVELAEWEKKDRKDRNAQLDSWEEYLDSYEEPYDEELMDGEFIGDYMYIDYTCR